MVAPTRPRSRQLVCRVARSSRGEVVVELQGELDLSTVGVLCEETAGLSDPRVVLDLERLTFLDASGLRAFADLAREAGLRGGGVVVRSPNWLVRRVIEMTDLAGKVRIE